LEVIERAGRELAGHEAELRLHRAVVRSFLGKALLNLDRWAEAAPVLEQAESDFRESPAGGSIRERRARTIEVIAMRAMSIEKLEGGDAGLAAMESVWARAEAELAQAPDDLVLREVAATAARVTSMRSATTRRARDAGVAAAAHYRVLMERQPSNPRWPFLYATCHLAECYYMLQDGQIEPARAAFRRFDSLLEPFVNANPLAATNEPLPQGIAILGPPPEQGILDSVVSNSGWLATLAAAAGDAEDTRAWLAKHWARLVARRGLVVGSPEWRVMRMDKLQAAAACQGYLHDWRELARLGQELLDEIEIAGRGCPDDAELRFRRALARGLIGAARLREERVAEAAAILPEAVEGVHDIPPALPEAFLWGARRLVLQAGVDWLARTGDIAQARSLLEGEMGDLAVNGGEPPGLNFFRRTVVAIDQVRLAELLDPADAPRRLALLEHAASILLSPEAEGRLAVDAKEAKVRLEAMRGTSG
jgi:hypothetical protein